MLSQEEREFQRYLDRKFAKADAVTRELEIAYYREEIRTIRLKKVRKRMLKGPIPEGATDGYAQGFAQGLLIGTIRTFQLFLNLPQTSPEILTSLAFHELQSMLEQLEQMRFGGTGDR